jgi:hypothetical protein
VHLANQQLRRRFLQTTVRLPTNQPNEHVRGLILVRQCVGNRYEGLSLLRFAALRQGNYATIDNYLKGELRYMDAGE